MRTRLYIALLLICFSSCRSDKNPQAEMEMDFSADVYPQRWELVEMTGMTPGSQTMGEDMDYQETYFFNRDNTFVKTRKEGEVTTEASGTYVLVTTEEGEQLYKLNYDADSDLIESCIGPREENLAVSTNRTLRGTAQACDYPGKTYERRE